MMTHSFVVCAYGESPYLDECLCSLANQSIPSSIIITTSTPNAYLEDMAAQYDVKYIVSGHEPSLASDWNFALETCSSDLVTIAHQDDTYEPQYLRHVIDKISKSQRPIIFFSDYGEIRDDKICNASPMLQVKRGMLLPLRTPRLWDSIFARRNILALGNPIACPSVTYVMKRIPKNLFSPDFDVDLDWDAWERLSKRVGSFVYDDTILMHHRIHEDSQTSKGINSNIRSKEDLIMFERFFPPKIASIMQKAYSISERQNKK